MVYLNNKIELLCDIIGFIFYMIVDVKKLCRDLKGLLWKVKIERRERLCGKREDKKKKSLYICCKFGW